MAKRPQFHRVQFQQPIHTTMTSGVMPWGSAGGSGQNLQMSGSGGGSFFPDMFPGPGQLTREGARVLGGLHCEDGPAVIMGLQVMYFWHGVHVPEWVIMEPEKIAMRDIIMERDIEMRRVLTERYGKGRFLSELGGMAEQKDSVGILWRVERDVLERTVNLQFDNELLNELLGRHKATKFVEVKDASTPRTYFIQVPTRVKTAKEGIAWSFGLQEHEYVPQFEA